MGIHVGHPKLSRCTKFERNPVGRAVPSPGGRGGAATPPPGNLWKKCPFCEQGPFLWCQIIIISRVPFWTSDTPAILDCVRPWLEVFEIRLQVRLPPRWPPGLYTKTIPDLGVKFQTIWSIHFWEIAVHGSTYGLLPSGRIMGNIGNKVPPVTNQAVIDYLCKTIISVAGNWRTLFPWDVVVTTWGYGSCSHYPASITTLGPRWANISADIGPTSNSNVGPT